MPLLVSLALAVPTPLVLLTALVSATLLTLATLELWRVEREQARSDAAAVAALPAVGHSYEQFLTQRVAQFTARQRALGDAGEAVERPPLW